MKKFREILKNNQGFTLVELMVTAILSLILTMIVMQLYISTQQLAQDILRKMELNAEARLMFDLLASGAFRDLDGDGNIDLSVPNERIPGLRSASTGVITPITINTTTLNIPIWYWSHATNPNCAAVACTSNSTMNNITTDLFHLAITNNRTPIPTPTNPPAIRSSDSSVRDANGASIGTLFSQIYNTPITGLLDTSRQISTRTVDIKLQLVEPNTLLDLFNNRATNGFCFDGTAACNGTNNTLFDRGILPNLKEQYRTSFYLVTDY